jgi:hypothetical protein
VPGDRITDRQVTRYMTFRRSHPQEAAAAKVGISVRSARRIEGNPVLPSQKPRRWWRSRSDPVASTDVVEIGQPPGVGIPLGLAVGFEVAIGLVG